MAFNLFDLLTGKYSTRPFKSGPSSEPYALSNEQPSSSPYPQVLNQVDEQPVVEDSPTINVFGVRPQTSQERLDRQEDPRVSMGNNKYLEEALLSVKDSDSLARREHTGMFGVKGTLRDILGVVGDAFLINGGRAPMYAPQRDKERKGAALAGFTESPEAAMSSVERLSAAGYTEEAQQLHEAIQNAQLRQAQMEGLQATRENQMLDRNWGNYQGARNAISRLMSSPAAQKYPELAYEQAAKIARAAGVSLEDLGISTDMSPEEREMYATGDMTVNQQVMLPRRDRALDQADYRNETSRISATRPSAAPRPRAETSDERLIRLGNKPPSQLTAGEKLWLEDRKKSSGRRPRAPSAPPSGGRNFRIVN